jgi:hypothetical protein
MPAGATLPAEPGAPLTTGTPTNKLERLAQIRESFQALAAGDGATAMRAAKQLTDDTERETALLALVTEWTKGELGSPRQRARMIALYGLEAGLGFELVKQPELALLWANELTESRGRVDLLQQVARGMISSDPAAAFALSDQVPEQQRRQFFEGLFSDWASRDTAAAIQWADQNLDPAQREAARGAIWNVAPVGIGAALSMQDGYPVINDLVPGMPAQLTGQLRAGDRIVGIAQGDSAFMDARSLGLSNVVQMIRGAPNTIVQLQVVPANAPANAEPQTVPVVRGQINFKR